MHHSSLKQLLASLVARRAQALDRIFISTAAVLTVSAYLPDAQAYLACDSPFLRFCDCNVCFRHCHPPMIR
ncbi:hypothetical protein FB107DRAFT_257004 [Schizophyllum commune]